MAKNPRPAAEAGTSLATPAPLDPETHYQVRVERIVIVQGRSLMPRHRHTIRGDFLEALPADDRAAVTILAE